jgi:DNA-damage-inducible protein D
MMKQDDPHAPTPAIRAEPSKHVMDRIHDARKTTPDGKEYWLARELRPLLGYEEWRNFKNAIERARMSCETNGRNAENHFVETTKMVEVGSGAMRAQRDYFLSKYACHLIAMNGDTTKVEIASAQEYFVVQTHRMDERDRSARDYRRLEARHRVTEQINQIGEVAKDIGVQRFPLFNAQRIHGLYGRDTVAEVKAVKGVPDGEQLLDVIGSWELALHEVQIGMTRQKLLDDGVTGEPAAIATNRKVAESLRQNVIENLGYGPEHLPCEEPIKVVEKRLRAQRTKSKKISGPTG